MVLPDDSKIFHPKEADKFIRSNNAKNGIKRKTLKGKPTPRSFLWKKQGFLQVLFGSLPLKILISFKFWNIKVFTIAGL